VSFVDIPSVLTNFQFQARENYIKGYSRLIWALFSRKSGNNRI